MVLGFGNSPISLVLVGGKNLGSAEREGKGRGQGMDLSQGSFSRVFPSQIQLLFPSPFLGPAPGKSRDPVGGWSSLPTINLISREFPGKFGNRAVPPWDFPGMFPELFQSSGRGLEVPQDLLGFPGRNSLGFFGIPWSSFSVSIPGISMGFPGRVREFWVGKTLWKTGNDWVGMGSLGSGWGPWHPESLGRPQNSTESLPRPTQLWRESWENRESQTLPAPARLENSLSRWSCWDSGIGASPGWCRQMAGN